MKNITKKEESVKYRENGRGKRKKLIISKTAYIEVFIEKTT
jgi:hypothetical protein